LIRSIKIFVIVSFVCNWNYLIMSAEMHLKEAIELLNSEKLTYCSQDVIDTIFESKENAIPFLISKFTDDSRFHGRCGSDYLCADVVEIDRNKIVTDTHDENKDITISHKHRRILTIVKDAALYLIMAILHNDLYFSTNALPDYPSEDKYDQALGEISILYVKSTVMQEHDFTLRAVQEILNKYKIQFNK